MFLTAEELQEILQEEEVYIRSLRDKWAPLKMDEIAEHKLRMGKRTELLGHLEHSKTRLVEYEDRGSDRNMH